MKTTLIPDVLERLTSGFEHTVAQLPDGRSPVHTVYGGAHLFSVETTAKLAAIARKSFETYAPDAESFGRIFSLSDRAAGVREKVARKLESEAVEDFRIDFEDGYGVRSSDEEDSHAVSAAEQTAAALAENRLPVFFGIRVKAFNGITGNRALRTLDLYLTKLVEKSDGVLPSNFVITLPKVSAPGECELLCNAIDEIERGLALDHGSIKIEIMVETARSLAGGDGGFSLRSIIDAARGRCVAAHFGAYDYLSELGVSAADQELRHPFCDLARGIMKLSLAGGSVDVVDGATNLMPVPLHRGSELTDSESRENRDAIHAAWKLHFDNICHGLRQGFYRGWDLHPAQFVARYAAVYAFFLDSTDEAALRLRSFTEKGARANLVGNSFDDAATGQGLLNYFRRAIDCGAITADELVERTGIAADDLRLRSFAEIIRRKYTP